MPTINVAKAFNLNLDAGSQKLRFELGVHEVSEEIASHWYVQEHLAAGGPSGAKKARDAADAAFLRANAAVEEYKRLERQAEEAELAAGIEVSEPAYRRLLGARDDEGDIEPNDAGSIPADIGNDLIQVGQGDETITATEAGNDSILGGQGNDVLAGNDSILAAGANDTLDAGAGNDTVAAPKASKKL